MKHMRCLLSLVILLGMSGVACAEDISLKPTPETVPKGSTQPVRFTWPTALGSTDAGLLNAKKATIGGQQATPVGNPTQQSITLTLPALDVVGTADVRVMDEKDHPIAIATLRYAGASDT